MAEGGIENTGVSGEAKDNTQRTNLPRILQQPEQAGASGHFLEWVRGLFRRKGDKSITPNRAQEPRIDAEKRQEQKTITPFDRTQSRDIDSLAEMGAPEFKVVPGNHWAMHYLDGQNGKNEAIQHLFAGIADPMAEVARVTPDALIYDTNDITAKGKESVSNRIQDIVTGFKHYDYQKFTQFIAEMSGTQMNAEIAERFYNAIANDKIRHSMLDEYHSSDLNRIIQTIKQEVSVVVANRHILRGMDKILAAARINVINARQLTTPDHLSAIAQLLTAKEKEIYDLIKNPYMQYIERGDLSSYAMVVQVIKDFHTVDQQQEQQNQEKSEEPRNQDQGKMIEPPDASDTYDPPKESKQHVNWYYQIEPTGTSIQPLLGYYAQRKDSLFDVARKTWSTPTTVIAYNHTLSGSERQKITGIVSTSIKSIPVPKGYAVDRASLNAQGVNATVTRDQNGCFYIQADGQSTFSIDFIKEELPFNKQPIPQDNEIIQGSTLSYEGETFLSSLQGNAVEKAQKIKAYIHSKHVYPDDAEDAARVQDAIKNNSTPDTYIQNLEKSEKLECYSSNTLFIAMLRKAGISARLVLGHYVTKSKDNAAVVDQSTAHAWVEIWDGRRWITSDATPPMRQSGQSTDEGDPQQTGDELGNQSQQKSEEEMPHDVANDQEKQQGEQNVDAARQAINEAEARKQEINEQMDQVDSFQEMERLKKELRRDPQLLNDMMAELEKRAEALERKMKDELREEIDNMMDDGFLDEKQNRQYQEMVDNADSKKLDKLNEQLFRDTKEYREYLELKEEVMPLVDYYYDYFVEKLPHIDVVQMDEETMGKKGKLDVRGYAKPVNQLYGRAYHPRVIKPEVRPLLAQTYVVDVSKSMVLDKTLRHHDPTKLNNAKKLLVFYNEFFSRIHNEFGYIKFSIYSFSDSINVIKRFDQDYDSHEAYDYPDGKRATVKVRMMQKMKPQWGTDILQAVTTAATDLNNAVQSYPEYMSSMQFIGDGGDQHGNAANVKRFLQTSSEKGGFGQEHRFHATMLGDESQRRVLADIFGEEHTTVAPDFETLIEESLAQFESDVEICFS
ncbi:MAG TPA: transglutaminase domain-containing protein [Candidatus Sulfotelmatobacter sp.]|nr:transglutaminase domain-containing protein [Candidatus Sulfotelmatobacter sp.]